MQFLFGGTFDPPHFGHSAIIDTLLTLAQPNKVPRAEVSKDQAKGPEAAAKVAAHAAEIAKPDIEVTVIPSFHPPAKNPPLLSFDQRVSLCQAAFLPLDSRVSVSTIEAQLAPPSYFLNTVTALAASRGPRRAPPGGCPAKPVMVIGFDQLTSLHRWYKAEQLFALVDIWVMDRDGEDIFSAVTSQLARFGVKVPAGWQLDQPVQHQQGSFRYVPFAQPQSSTVVRQKLIAGQLAQVKSWLHPEVYARLNEPNFYRIEGDSWKPTP